MKRGSTLFLRIALLILVIPILALCIFLLPQIAIEAFEHAKQGATLAYVVFGILLAMYASAVPFFVALYQAWKLVTYIDQSKAFSNLSVTALKNIKRCALVISGLYAVALPFIAIMAQWDDAPGLIVIGLVIVGASIVVAVFAAVLQMLLREAIQIKSENELTV